MLEEVSATGQSLEQVRTSLDQRLRARKLDGYLILPPDFLQTRQVEFFNRNPGDIFSLSTLQAGGVFSGGLIGALLAAVWYIRKHRMPAMATCDAFAPGLALGHAIGRVGHGRIARGDVELSFDFDEPAHDCLAVSNSGE